MAGFTAEDLILTNLTSGVVVPAAAMSVSVDAATNVATVTFSGLPGQYLADGNYRARLVGSGVSDGAGNPVASDFEFEFFFLNGDANRDARVNLADFNILAANFGQSNRTFSEGDFNYDGLVNLSDFNILASRFGRSLGPDGVLTMTGERPPALGSTAARQTSWGGGGADDDDDEDGRSASA